MKKKKLVILFWDLGIGGVGTQLLDVAQKFNERDDVETFFLLKRRAIGRLPEKEYPNIHFKYFTNDIYRGKQLQFLFWLLKSVIDIAPTHMYAILPRFGFIISVLKTFYSLKGVQVHAVFNQPIGTEKYLKQYEIPFFGPIIMRWIVSKVDRIIVPSKHNRQELIDKFSATKNKVFQINNFVLETNISRSNHKKVNDFCFIGRFSKEKGLETVLQTMLEYRNHKTNFTCALVGSGPQEVWIKNQIVKHKLQKNITFFGFSNKARLLLSRSKLLILPSYNEGMPITILEAYIEGVPVAVTPFDGADEVVDNDIVGIIVPRKKFAVEVSKLLLDNRRLLKYARQTKPFVSKNYSEKNRDNFIDLILV